MTHNSGPHDSGPHDTGPHNTGPHDTGTSDTGVSDAGPSDTGPSDTGPSDTGPSATGANDAGASEAAGQVTDVSPSPELGHIRAGSHWSRDWPVVLAILIIKVVVLAWGVRAARVGELSERDYRRNFHHHRLTARWHDRQDIRFFELWVSSDAQWYNAIAENGYPERSADKDAGPTSGPKLIEERDTHLKYAFFPLWPLIIRLCMLVIHDVDAAGFVAANLFSVAALVLLYRFAVPTLGRPGAFWGVMTLTTFPFAMFLHVPFTEPLFLLLAVAAAVMIDRDRWVAASICCGLAMVTRPTGLAVAAMLPIGALLRHYRNDRPSLGGRPWAAMLALTPLPLLAYATFCYVKTGDPLFFTQVQDWWGYGGTSHLANLWGNTGGAILEFGDLPLHGFHRSRIDAVVMAGSLLLLVAGLFVLPAHLTVFSALVLLIPLMVKSDLMSFGRYAMVAWPLCMVGPCWLGRFRAYVLLPTCLLFLWCQLVAISEFVNWHWVG